MTKRRNAAIWLAEIIGVLLIVAYLVLPAVVLSLINRKLARLHGYEGRVEAVSLRPLRSEVGLQGLALVARGGKAAVPLVAVANIDVRYSWKELLHGALVGDMVLRRPVIHYIFPPKGAPKAGPQPPPEAVKQAAKTSAQAPAKAQGAAYDLRRVDVQDGRIEIQDDEVKPGYVLSVKDLKAEAFNIASRPSKRRMTAMATGVVMDKGDLKADFAADAFAAKPTFQYAITASSVAVPQFNDWLRHYLAIETHGGVLNFYSEAKCDDGKVKGYVKPIIVGLAAVKVKGGQSIGKQLLGQAEKLASQALRNPRMNQIGTQVPFSGDLSKPKVGVFPALVELVRNAFFQAISPGLRGLVDFKSLEKKARIAP